jgi:membrane-bound lytic murein transglycosylase B
MSRRPFAVALAFALVLPAACSGDDGTAAPSPSSTSGSSSTTTAAPTTTAPVDVFALRPPEPADSPAGLAAQLADAEAVARDPEATEVEVASAALAQQVAYRWLGDHPDWDAAVQAALPSALRPVAAKHAAARRDLRALGTPKPALPAWRIVAPAPLAELEADYRGAAAEFGLPWSYLAAIHLVETGTGRIRGTSDAGAQGPMQFLPATWEAYGGGGDINDTHDAIYGAARYLAANDGATDMAHALYRYNHSDHYVRAVTTYAELYDEHPLALRAFRLWGVWYRTVDGDVYLPVGYGES